MEADLTQAQKALLVKLGAPDFDGKTPFVEKDVFDSLFASGLLYWEKPGLVWSFSELGETMYDSVVGPNSPWGK